MMMNSMTEPKPLHVTTFNSFQVNKLQSFDILLSHHVKPIDLHVSITSLPLGSIEKQLDWSSSEYQQVNKGKCTVSFKVPVVGIYNVRVELTNQAQLQHSNNCIEFQAKAYDLSKVLIQNSSGQCRVNESYEFGVDASEAGEGQLEIAVNEGEIPNQVQVLDNGKCIVNFVPEEAVPHVVDIKFNGHNVIGCPFVVQVDPVHGAPNGLAETDTRKSALITEEPKLITNERILVNSRASFALENIQWDQIDKSEVIVVDPENRPIEYSVTRDSVKLGNFRFEFTPATVGDHLVKLAPHSQLNNQLPYSFPFSLKVFDFNKVLVSDVTDGVIGHPVYFFIDASQAGSGNLEIRVSSETRNVPNYPQQEANAKIRVNFTPTEAVDHTIDVKFNGISVPNNPFIVKVAQFPKARLPVQSQDLLKYVAVDETVEFNVEYLENNSRAAAAANELTSNSCSITVLKPDFTCVRLDDIELIRLQQADKNDNKQQQAVAIFKIRFKATKIGPYKLFITVDNELLPGSPILSNVYNIHEVKVLFEREGPNAKPAGKMNEPVAFMVDASRAGEGTLALAVVSSRSSNPVATSVDVSDKGHGLYNLSFIPTEFAVHSIDMSFNDRVVPGSPFIVDILNANGESALGLSQQQQQRVDAVDLNGSPRSARELAHDMSGLSLKHNNAKTKSKAPAAPPALSKEDEMFQSLVVHGVSLKRTPVNSTGAFIIETNQMADPKDFDVLIAGPSNSLVDVRCYRDQADNLTVEWEPVRVGTHKIEVLYRNRPVPGSPFMSEAFDPSGVILETLDSSQFMLEDLVELRINRKQAGLADLEVLLTSPEGEEQPVEVQAAGVVDVASFRPSVPGRYRVSVTYGGYEVPRSPVTFSVRDNREPVKVSGPGLRCAEVNRSAQFNVESSSDGELKLRIECGDREIVPKVERIGRSYAIKYKPTDIGCAIISLYWDGSHIDGSPFSVPVNDLTKFAFVNSHGSKGHNGAATTSGGSQITLNYEPRLAREITLDTSACGPGELKAEAYCRANPNIKFSIPVNQVTTGRYKLIFTCPPGPEQLATGTSLKDFPVEATYLIRFYYNNLAVPETLASVSLSPSSTSRQSASNSGNIKHAPSSVNSASLTRENGTSRSLHAEQNNNNNSRPAGEVVALRGHGLAEAKCGEVAEFTIDGHLVGHGGPQVKLFGSSEEVKVHLEPLEEHLYKATYVPLMEGAHTLNVLWDGKQVAGCPITVSVLPGCDSSRVICTADSLKGGVLGEEIKTFIDTRKAGPGELTALCTGPAQVAFCELLDRGDGTFVLYIKPQESGRHSLAINYGGQHIPKSPFSFKVSGRPDPTRVRVYGPGVEHGVLPHYQSRFMCDTRGAGAGQLTVRIRGPKGAFRMETERANQKDRTILCKYDPTEPGDYRIEIKWSGRHVPGSPFSVMIFDTQEELNRFLLSRQQQQQQQAGSHHSVGSKKHSGGSNGALPAHQVPPFQPTLVEYGHYSSSGAPAGATQHQQPPFRLQ